MSALAGGVFAATGAQDDDGQLRQLVDDLGQRSYDAGLGHRGIPDQFDAELWGNLEDTGLARLTSTPDMGAGPHELAVALYGVARHAGAVPRLATVTGGAPAPSKRRKNSGVDRVSPALESTVIVMLFPVSFAAASAARSSQACS